MSYLYKKKERDGNLKVVLRRDGEANTKERKDKNELNCPVKFRGIGNMIE